MSKTRSAISLGWLSLLVCMPVWAARYSVIELPAPLREATALNENGDVVGATISGTPAGPSGAFLYQHSSRVVIELPCPDLACSSQANAINDHATAVGQSTNVSVGPQAVRWPLSGGAEILPHFAFGSAMGIANNGDVVGISASVRAENAVIWKADGTMIFLGNLVHCGQCVFAPNSSADAINDRGHVAGYADWAVLTTPDPYGPFLSGMHAFLWRDGAMTDLGALGDGSFSSASALNNADEVVGVSSVGPVNTAFLYSRGQMRNLGNLGHRADLNSAANGINDWREIVGWSEVRLPPSGTVVQRAFLYSFGHMWNLNFLIDPRSDSGGRVKLTNAVAINCNGWIAANGYDVRSGEPHAYLLRPHGPQRRGCHRHPG